MFGMGMGELILIAVVALLALGPDKLPDAAKRIGKTIRDLRRQTGELKRTIESDAQLGDAMKEIRSALRDDPFRDPPKPRQKPTPPTPPKPPAEAGKKPAGAAQGDEPAVEPAEGAVARGEGESETAAAEATPEPADDAETMPIEVGELEEVDAAEVANAAAAPDPAPAATEPVMINMSEYQRYVHMWGPEAAAEKYGTSLEEAEAAIRAVVGSVKREPSDG